MKKINKENAIIIYQKENGAVELRGDLTHETMWANLNQIAELFDTDKSGISRHINNIFKSGEMDKKRTVANFATVQIEGTRKVKRRVEYFDLDVILAVGYKINSEKAILFRKWTTKVLRSYITQGYVINKKQVAKNYQSFLEAINDVKSCLPKNKDIDNDSILELVRMFADTWFSLSAYDKDSLEKTGYTKKKVSLSAKKLSDNLEVLKNELISKKEASDLFARESKEDNLSGIIGNIMQSFGGKNLYGTIEEKAANLLYLIIKNHPFIDGNKRSAAYAFIWFLNQAKILNINKITPPALTALTILIAESNPREKEKMINLILTILGKKG
jgi:death-on-curing family protein